MPTHPDNIDIQFVTDAVFWGAAPGPAEGALGRLDPGLGESSVRPPQHGGRN